MSAPESQDRAPLPTAPIPTVLIVDDEPDQLGLLTAYFDRAGCSVIGLADAEQALALPLDVGLDLMVLDLSGTPTGEAVNSGPVVVIADDDADIRHLVGVAVRRAGARTGASVADGAAAWQAIRAMKPDLVILDVAMPRMNGLQVCRSVRANPDTAGTKVLLLSAAVHPTAIDAGLAAGADLYSVKPFRLRSLVTQIQDLLAAKVSG